MDPRQPDPEAPSDGQPTPTTPEESPVSGAPSGTEPGTAAPGAGAGAGDPAPAEVPTPADSPAGADPPPPQVPPSQIEGVTTRPAPDLPAPPAARTDVPEHIAPTEASIAAEQARLAEVVKNYKAGLKCVALFIIMSVIYFWNLYCLLYMIPKIEQRFEDQHIEMAQPMQHRYKAVSQTVREQRWIALLPIVLMMGAGIAAVRTRAWSVCSGVFFTVILLLFLFFLYGWMLFALPLMGAQAAGGG